MVDIISICFIVINLVNLFVLIPVVYPAGKILIERCGCALDYNFAVICVYLLITVGILIGSIMTHLEILDLSNRSSRIIIVAYFLLTFIFVQSATSYIEKKRIECACFSDSYKKLLFSLTVIRWIGVYFFGVILMSAGIFLFLKSKEQPFSFPRRTPRTLSV